jgi:hypothetical protein
MRARTNHALGKSALAGFALLWASLSVTVSPARAEEKWASMGAGVTTCAKFGQFMKQYPDDILFFTWAQGYLTGLNVHMELSGLPFTDYKAITTDEENRRIMAYCDKHPLALYMTAVENLFAEMRREQGLAAWVRPQGAY